MKKMSKCPKCGENDFWVVEWELYRGEFVDGRLKYARAKENGIDSVTCRNCDETLDISEIEAEYVG